MDEFTLSRIQEIFSYFQAHCERAEEREKTKGKKPLVHRVTHKVII